MSTADPVVSFKKYNLTCLTDICIGFAAITLALVRLLQSACQVSLGNILNHKLILMAVLFVYERSCPWCMNKYEWLNVCAVILGAQTPDDVYSSYTYHVF